MKNIINIIRTQAALALLAVLLFAAAPSLTGQGWTSTSNSNGGNCSVVAMTGYTNNKLVMLARYPDFNQTSFTIHNFIGERLSSYSPVPNDASPDIDYFPAAVSSFNLDASTYVLANKFNQTTGEQTIHLLHYTSNPEGPRTFVWSKPLYNQLPDFATGLRLVKTNDGQLLALGTVSNTANGEDMVLIKSDLDGNVSWSNTYAANGTDAAVQVIPAADGGYWLLKTNASPELFTWLMKTDAFGEMETEVMLSGTLGDQARDMIQTSDGNFAITGQTANEELYVLKIDTNGNAIWRRNYTTEDYTSYGNSLVEDESLNLVVVGSSKQSNSPTSKAFLTKLSATGTPLWEREYMRTVFATGQDANNYLTCITLTPSGQYIMGGSSFNLSSPGLVFSIFIKTDTLGLINGGHVRGNVFYDLNMDCTANEEDVNLAGWVVKVANDTLSYYGNTDANGNYEILVKVTAAQDVNYTVSIFPPSELWETCQNDIPIVIGYQDTLHVDFPIQAVVACPFMETQISSSNFRICDTTLISIGYCNNGTVAAEDAYIEVELDPSLDLIRSSIAPSQVTDNTYTFALGDVAFSTCGQFTITAVVSCDSVELGQAVCLSSHIFPDTLCVQSDGIWSGALLHADYTCEEDGVQFRITNVGNATMNAPLEYVIIEDAVLLRQETFNLDPAQAFLPALVPQTGATYTLLAHQEPGAPGAELISISANACAEDGQGTVNAFPQYTGTPYIHTYCLVVVGSYDPNDKQAIPEGFGQNNGIHTNTDINYTIRFQNTGTDTAFRVMIKDTLSPFLHPGTFQPGPASHPYTWRFEGQAVVFNFNDIALPDSTANLQASQGFVSFNIAQKRDLPVGQVIENRAGIYFDFNAPIITNTVFHTVSEFITIINETVDITRPNVSVQVSPNPLTDAGAWIQVVTDTAPFEALALRLFDMAGNQVRTMKGTGNSFWLQRGDLPAGMYFFTIQDTNGEVVSGKLIIQ